jgi:hypothetical protein
MCEAPSIAVLEPTTMVMILSVADFDVVCLSRDQKGRTTL